MESLANLGYRHHHLPLNLHHRRPTVSKPISSLSFPATPSLFTRLSSLKTTSFSTPTKASFYDPISPSPNLQQEPPISPLKTTLIAVVAATALFLSQFNLKPVFAAAVTARPPPPATVGFESGTTLKTESESVVDSEIESSLEERLSSNPNDVVALRSLMEVKLKGRKLKEAIGLLNKLLILEPNDVEWPMLKAYMSSYTGDHEAAKKAFDEIISKDPLRVEAYHGLIMVASQRESEGDLVEVEKKVLEGIEKAKKLSNGKEEREFYVLLAQILVIKGDYDDALGIYKELIKQEPRDFRPYLCRGIIYTLLKNDADAESNFKQYRKLVPKGHPYVEYFEDNMKAAKLFVQREENEKAYSKGE